MTCLVATLEDMILAKLHWYREGGEASERQWQDVVGMLAAGKDSRFRSICARWASDLSVQDLLDRAISEA